MMTEETILEPVLDQEGVNQPLLAAELWYLIHSQIPFAQDLWHYLRTGFVVSRPTCFGMATLIDLGSEGEKELGWFIRFLTGDILELITTLPCYTPRIAFCRHNQEWMRVYRLDRLIALARALARRRKEITYGRIAQHTPAELRPGI